MPPNREEKTGRNKTAGATTELSDGQEISDHVFRAHEENKMCQPGMEAPSSMGESGSIIGSGSQFFSQN